MSDETILTGKSIISPLIGDILKYAVIEKADDGDIFLRKKLDGAGAYALRGNHTNYGYSGYVIGELIFKGAKRKILNWRDLFENNENFYDSQQNAPDAIEAAENAVRALRGTRIIKVTRGWEIL